MSNEQDSKGGEGRGLPRGWEWREGTGSLPPVVSSYLYAPGADDYNAGAYNDGAWIAYSGESRAEMVDEYDPAPGGPYSPALLAAAQAAAEAALWRCDGFGTDEVRGVWLSLDAGSEVIAAWMMRRAVALPGLPGMWRVMDGREVEGGVEVDAVRAQAEPTPRRSRPMPPVAPGAGRGEGDEEDEPDPCAKHGTTGSNIGWQVWCPGCNVALHREPAPREPSAPACPRALPCTRLDPHHEDDCTPEPSAPTDGELARLLPGLADYCAVVLAESDEDTRSRHSVGKRLARAVVLLLAERAILARSFGDTLKREDRAFGLRVAFEQGRATERARAEEAVCGGGVAVSSATRRSVAALLRAVEEAAGTSADSAAKIEAGDGEDAADYQSGHAHGLQEAASLIRATLTPSPLDGVVAEVCALPVEMPTFYASVDSVEDGLHAVDMLIGDHELPRRDRLARIARVALAGMLACDAAAKGGARG